MLLNAQFRLMGVTEGDDMNTILLSETQSYLLQLLEWEFSDAGFACICVEGIDQAKEVLIGERVDAVVLGLGLPVEEDLYILFWVKKYFPHTPVVLFAGEEQVQPSSIKHVADAWVEKSSDVHPLIEKVKHLTQDRLRSRMMSLPLKESL